MSSLSNEVILRNKRMLDSFKKLLGYELIKRSSSNEDAKNLYDADFIVLSHGNEPDPILKYGNKKALELFEVTFDELIKMPSRFTAEEEHRDTRQKLLNEVSKNGYISNYSGIRISKLGKRFMIKNAIVWNVIDESDMYIGKAATFKEYEYIK